MTYECFLFVLAGPSAVCSEIVFIELMDMYVDCRQRKVILALKGVGLGEALREVLTKESGCSQWKHGICNTQKKTGFSIL
jgi:hypothetical protein